MNRTSLAVLTGRAFSLVGRHWIAFAAVAVIAIVAEWFVYRKSSIPEFFLPANILISAIVDAIVLGIAKGDVDGWNPSQTWERILERSWAVIIIAFVSWFVTVYGLQLLRFGGLLDRFFAIPILLIAASIVFAEAIAIAVDEEMWWFIIARSLGTSIRTSWTGSTLARAIAIFALGLLPFNLAALIAAAVTHGDPTTPSFWTDVPLGIVWSIPLDVLTVLAYFDATGYEPKRTCGE